MVPLSYLFSLLVLIPDERKKDNSVGPSMITGCGNHRREKVVEAEESSGGDSLESSLKVP